MISSPTRRARSLSRNSSDRRPMGPRTPSPLPPVDDAQSTTRELPSIPLASYKMAETPVRPSGLPRSKRQPFYPVNNADATPKPVSSNTTGSSVEPLSIKKKIAERPLMDGATLSYDTPVNAKKSSSTRGKASSPRRTTNRFSDAVHPATEQIHQAIQYSQATKEDVSTRSCPSMPHSLLRA